MELQKKSKEQVSRLERLMDEMMELSQPRSEWLLRKEVIGQHPMPGRQRQQCLNELNGLMFALGDMSDRVEQSKLELDALEDNDWDKIERRRILRQIKQTEITMHGRMREVEILLKILDEIEPYTMEQLEAEEPEYWTSRLETQAFLTQRGDYSNLSAVYRMDSKIGEPSKRILNDIDKIKALAGMPPDKPQLENKNGRRHERPGD